MAILRVDAQAIRHLSSGRRTALVAGTNGKSTTTALIAAGVDGSVAFNSSGANIPTGIAAALAEGAATTVVLEVDELYLDRMIEETSPEIVVLLNLSRDQLDRMHEISRVATAWRKAIEGRAITAVANCADPHVVFAVGDAPCVWFDPGFCWTDDALTCPRCGGLISWTDATWSCACGFAMPEPDVRVVGETIIDDHGVELVPRLRLPGAINVGNAAAALAAVQLLGTPAERALPRMQSLDSVWGRYGIFDVGGRAARLLLAKNPASWRTALDMVADDAAVVVGINARALDGRDTSWLYDVPFEVFADRPVGVTGDRRADLALRLHLAGARPVVDADVHALAARMPSGPLVLIGNYTCFMEWRRGAAWQPTS